MGSNPIEKGMNTKIDILLPNLKEMVEILENEAAVINPSYLVQQLQTNEFYRLNELITLVDYYSDLNLENPQNPRVQKGYSTLEDFVENRVESVAFRLEDNYYLRDTSYGFTNSQKIGRMYSELPTAQSFQREIRFFLFKSEYVDVDLVNSHASILYDFAQKAGIQTIALEKLVQNRTEFFDQMLSEKDRLIIESPKKTAIITFNLIDTTEHKEILRRLPTNCVMLYSEVELLRRELFDRVTYNSDKTYNSLKGFLKAKYKTLDDSAETRRAAQIYYCFTQESRALLLLKENLSEFANLQGFSFLPIFDGALVRVTDSITREDLAQVLISTNQEIFPLSFKESPLKLESDLLDEDTFKRYLNINQFLGQLESSSKVEKLVKYLNIKPFKLTGAVSFSAHNSEFDYFLDDPAVKSKLELEIREYQYNFRSKLLKHAGELDSLHALLKTALER